MAALHVDQDIGVQDIHELGALAALGFGAKLSSVLVGIANIGARPDDAMRLPKCDQFSPGLDARLFYAPIGKNARHVVA
jgi:hypothetical protein